MAKTTMTIPAVTKTMDKTSELMSMEIQLRQAIFGAITERDVSDIIKKQVEKAKAGDEKALQFVMKYVLGFGQ